ARPRGSDAAPFAARARLVGRRPPRRALRRAPTRDRREHRRRHLRVPAIAGPRGGSVSARARGLVAEGTLRPPLRAAPRDNRYTRRARRPSVRPIVPTSERAPRGPLLGGTV